MRDLQLLSEISESPATHEPSPHPPKTYSESHDMSSGVRIRMVRRCTGQRVPTVRQLIDTLAKKHEHLLLEEIRQRSYNVRKCSKNTTSSTLPTDIHHNLKSSLSSNSINEAETDRSSNARCRKQRENFHKQRLKFSASVDKLSWDNHIAQVEATTASPTLPLAPLPSTNNYSRVNHFKMNGLRSGLVNKSDNFPTSRSTDHKVRKAEETIVATGTPCTSANDTVTESPSINASNATTCLPFATKHRVDRLPPPPIAAPHKPLHLSCIRQSLPPPEPKYTDPIVGGTASYQARMGELAALEAETVRYERSRRARRKAKQDRDS